MLQVSHFHERAARGRDSLGPICSRAVPAMFGTSAAEQCTGTPAATKRPRVPMWSAWAWVMTTASGRPGTPAARREASTSVRSPG